MSEATTQPWFVWDTEYPEEGSHVCDAVDEADAKKQYLLANGCTGCAENCDVPELTAERATAECIFKLQEELGERTHNQYQLRQLILKAVGVLGKSLTSELSDHEAINALHDILDGTEYHQIMNWKYDPEQEKKKEAA